MAAASLARGEAGTTFPAADLDQFRTITQDTLAKVTAGDQSGARTRIADLETLWDHDQDRLQSMNPKTWSVLDHEIDTVLKSIRSGSPSVDNEKQSLAKLLASLR
ncbi:hypothetical protein FZI93_32735 [Mycobacterium sp. CBMA361]|nr:hypothetical protein [Mycolicibacterium sp. CBMA 361]